MKSFKSFAYVAAIALIGLAVTSCKEKNQPENTGYDANRETVKTQFSISLPSSVAGSAALRMPDTTVQVEEDLSTFRGIDNIVLIPYTITTPGETPVLISSTNNSNRHTLGDINESGSNMEKTNQNAKLYNDVFVPVGTNAFLFYGKAIGSNPTGTSTTKGGDDDRHNLGILVDANYPNVDGAITLSDIKFSPEHIHNGGRPATNHGNDLIAYLNALAGTTTDASVDDEYKIWAKTTEPRLMAYYNQLTEGTAETGLGMKAGSSASIRALMIDLWSKVNAVAVDPKYSDLKAEILKNINSTTYVKTAEEGNGEFVFKDDYNDFPADINMPDGAAVISWNTSSENFEIADDGTFGAVTIAKFSNYVYPAALYYFANTLLHASDAEKVSETFGTEAWADIVNSSDATKYKYQYQAVKSTTRSIALEKQINYGVGRFDLAIRSKTNVLADANTVNVDITKIKLTGVLIGGINDAQWDFTPASDAKTYIYYDNKVIDQTVPQNDDASWTPASWNNYTLVLESKADEVLNFALEFENQDKEFHGVNGQVIPKGTKFYLVGSLKPSEGKGYVTGTKDKVFIQDHKTIAKVTIADLKNKAYNVIPDLKAPQLELALSVNLEWQEGLVFDLTL